MIKLSEKILEHIERLKKEKLFNELDYNFANIGDGFHQEFLNIVLELNYANDKIEKEYDNHTNNLISMNESFEEFDKIMKGQIEKNDK